MGHVHSFVCTPVAKAADKSKLSEIEQLAERIEPKLARALNALLTEHADRIDLDKLEEALKRGDTLEVMRLVGSTDALHQAAVKAALEDALWAGGALAAQGPVFAEARFAFNRLNPALVRWLENYSLNLIRGIDTGTTESVRAALVKGMTAGQNPIQQARAIKESIGLTPAQAQSVANYRRELETFHLKRSAKSWGLGNERSKLSGVEVMPRDAKGRALDGIHARRLRDQRHDATLQRALETKKPIAPEKIEAMVKRYAAKMLKNRARTIARTESIRATSAGVYEAWRQAIESGKVDGARVRKFWRVAHDERACEICLGIEKAVPKRGVSLTEPFANPNGDPLLLPPAHPSCRCSPQIRLFEAVQLLDEAA